MRKGIKQFGISLMVVLALSACQHLQPVYNVDEAAVPMNSAHPLSAEKVGAIIRKTAQSQGWNVSQPRAGELRCTTRWQDHEAVVSIHYTASSYTIELVSSENLKESDGMIHHRYNARVHKLQNAIDKRLSHAAF